MKDLLQFISEGGQVQRYHTRPGLRADTDAAHSFGVAMLCAVLAGKDIGCQNRTRARAELLMAALTHDLAEQLTGDVSAPAKRKLGMGAELARLETDELEKWDLNYEQFLTEDERVVLKLADCFDGMLYCCREAALGNRTVGLIWRRYCTYVETLRSAVALDVNVALRAANMYESIKEMYAEATSVEGPCFDVFA